MGCPSNTFKIDIPTIRPAITIHCPLFKVMLLKIGNPPSPLMCCAKAVSILTGRDTDFRKWSVEWPTNV
jgi:hypothetical protein